MKRVDSRLRRLVLVFVFVFCSFGFTGQALAEDYFGDFCWKIFEPGSESDAYSVGKFGVTEVGKGHFRLDGKFTNYEDNMLEGSVLEATEVAHGNAELVDSTIVATITATSYDESGDYGFNIMRWHLDLSTLSGTFKVISVEYEPSFGSDLDEGSVEFLPNCK